MKTNKLSIKVRAGSLISSIAAKQKEINRLTKRLLKLQNQCNHKSEINARAEKTYEVFFDCSECLFKKHMKTLFLDFDGVLNNDGTKFLIKNYVEGDHVGFDRANSNVLNNFIENLCTECVDVNLPADSSRHDKSCTECVPHNELKIVICSTWRNFYTLVEMKGLLKFYLEDQWIDLIQDTTKVDLEFKKEHTRAGEVKNYIDKHNITDYIILDDECSYDEFPEMEKYWIKTNAGEGLTEEDIRKWKEKNT